MVGLVIYGLTVSSIPSPAYGRRSGGCDLGRAGRGHGRCERLGGDPRSLDLQARRRTKPQRRRRISCRGEERRRHPSRRRSRRLMRRQRKRAAAVLRQQSGLRHRRRRHQSLRPSILPSQRSPDAVPVRSTRMTSVIASASGFATSSRSVLLLAETKRPVTTVPSMVKTLSGVPGSSIMMLSQRPTGEGAADARNDGRNGGGATSPPR